MTAFLRIWKSDLDIGNSHHKALQGEAEQVGNLQRSRLKLRLGVIKAVNKMNAELFSPNPTILQMRGSNFLKKIIS